MILHSDSQCDQRVSYILLLLLYRYLYTILDSNYVDLCACALNCAGMSTSEHAFLDNNLKIKKSFCDILYLTYTYNNTSDIVILL